MIIGLIFLEPVLFISLDIRFSQYISIRGNLNLEIPFDTWELLNPQKFFLKLLNISSRMNQYHQQNVKICIFEQLAVSNRKG